MSTHNITITGFNNQVRIDNDKILYNNCSIDLTPKIIYSTGAFNDGNQYSNSSLLGLNGIPRLENIDCTINIDFECGFSTLNNLIKKLLNNRTEPVQIRIKNLRKDKNNNKESTFNNCYWNQITLGVKQHEFLKGSINFTIVQDAKSLYSLTASSYVINSDNISSTVSSISLSSSMGTISDLEQNEGFIPYYATNIHKSKSSTIINNSSTWSALEHDNLYVLNWDVTLTQAVTPKTFCGVKLLKSKNSNLSANSIIVNNTIEPIATQSTFAPKAQRISFGMLTAELKMQLLTSNGVGQELSQEKIFSYMDMNEDTLTINNNLTNNLCINYIYDGNVETFLELHYLILKSITPNISDAGNYSTLDLNYASHKIKIPN